MARDFGDDKSNEWLDSGDNVFSAMNISQASHMAWVNQKADIASGTRFYVAGIDQLGGSMMRSLLGVAPASGTGWRLEARKHVTSVNSRRQSSTLSSGVWYAAVGYTSRQNVATLPDVYVNGTLDNATSNSGSGTLYTGDDTLRLGANATDTSQADAEMAFIGVASGSLGAAGANRHRWWGMAPGGPSTMLVCLPLWTDDLANKGTAGTATFTATGTTMTSIPKVERCWASTMGCGR